MQQWAAIHPDPVTDAQLGVHAPAAPAPALVGASNSPAMPSVPSYPLTKLPSRDEALVSAALCSLPANDPLCQALLLAHTRGGAQLSETLARGLSLPVEHAFSGPPPPSHLGGIAPVAGDSTAAPLIHAQVSPLLKARVAGLDALLTTLRRVRAERGTRCENPTTAGGTADDPFAVFDAQPPAPPPAMKVDDGFDVFD
jgi:hypothetical protein